MFKFKEMIKNTKRSAAVAMSVVLASAVIGTSALAAPVYKDVPGTHWAYASISAVADRGFIVGDTTGNFKPDENLDKFATSKILAKAAGFKYENLTSSEQTYYNACYDKNKSLLSQYSNKFSKWNTSADKEIAFLLEREILTASDLDQFVILVDGTEKLRALSRGELAMFLVKLRDENANASVYTVPDSAKFADDAQITEPLRKYIYYAKSIGIFTGEPGGSFESNSAVTKAAMAITLDRALGLTASSASAPTATPNTAGTTSNISAVNGTFDKYFPDLAAIQLIDSGTGEKKIYKLSGNASVYVDNYIKTAADLSAGMTVEAVVNNNELVDLRAKSTGTAGGTGSTGAPANTSAIEGTVASAEVNGSTRTMGIEVKMINPRDNSIVSDIKTYTLAADCAIYRGEELISFSEVAKGDIVTADVSGSTVYKLLLEQKSVIISEGTLVEKDYDETTGIATVVVSDSKAKLYNFRVTSSANLARKNVTGTVTWDKLRIGDTVDVTAEYGSVISLMAYGVVSTTDGWINEINIGRTFTYLNLRDAEGKINKYYLIKHATDPYSLRVGDKVRLRLDSKEISTVMLLEEASTTTVTGYISTVKSGVITLRDTQPYGTNGKRDIYLDANTTYTNAVTGEKITYNALSAGQKVYIVCKSVLSNDAVSVTVLVD